MRNRLPTILKATAIVVLTLVTGHPAWSPAAGREQRARVGSLLKKSQAHLAAGHYDSALVSLEGIRDIEPNNQDAFYLSAILHLAQSDTAGAIVVLTEGIERAPLSTRLKLLRVRLHIEAGEYGPADDVLAEVFRFKRNNPEGLYLSGLASLARGDTSRALEAWETALARLQKKGRGGRAK